MKLSTRLIPDDEVTRAPWDSRSGTRYIEIKIRPETLIAICISLLFHGVVLFALPPNKLVKATSLVNSRPKTINVHIAGLPAKKPLEIKKTLKPIPLKQKPPTPSVIAVENKTSSPLPKPAFKIPLNEDNSPPKDFMSFVQARRQHAQDAEAYAARENENARTPSDEELRDANIKSNLQQPGTSGIFEIRRKSTTTAQFSFKGWKNAGSIPRLELIDVTAGTDGKIDLAIVKKMIAIIRREYKGDFNWESQRLGRVIVLSARMEDNAGLEEFIMREFFSQRDY